MKENKMGYDDLITKINSLQATLLNLKSKLNSVYNMCDEQLNTEVVDDEIKDTKNERRR